MTRRQFFGTALLSLCAARAHAIHHRRRTLLPEDSRPPLFTLPDSTGQPVALSDFLGQKRIALIFRPLAVYFDDVLDAHGEFEARDLIVIGVGTPTEGLEETPSQHPVYVLTDRAGAILRAYGAGGRTPTFYLIGKDGTIKMARHGYPSNKELFGMIDAMPMRRQEMRERGH